MKRIYYVVFQRDRASDIVRYFEHRGDAIKYINDICDDFRNAPLIRGVKYVDEPCRKAYEAGERTPVYYADVHFETHNPIKYYVESAPLY